MLFGQFAVVLILVFVADASVTAWRRGDRRKALMVGGSVEFLVLAGLGTAVAVLWGNIQVRSSSACTTWA
jgi:two-component system, LuxR family, sensor kinase FixL